MFSPDMYLPKPRVATHARYRGKNDPKILKYTEVLNVMFQRGAGYKNACGSMYVCTVCMYVYREISMHINTICIQTHAFIHL